MDVSLSFLPGRHVSYYCILLAPCLSTLFVISHAMVLSCLNEFCFTYSKLRKMLAVGFHPCTTREGGCRTNKNELVRKSRRNLDALLLYLSEIVFYLLFSIDLPRALGTIGRDTRASPSYFIHFPLTTSCSHRRTGCGRGLGHFTTM